MRNLKQSLKVVDYPPEVCNMNTMNTRRTDMQDTIIDITMALRCGHSIDLHPASSSFDFPEEAVRCSECDHLSFFITEEDMGQWFEVDGQLISRRNPTIAFAKETA